MIEYPALTPYRIRCADLPVQPLRITAVLRPNAPLVSYDPIHLDNFLACCVVMDCTAGAGLPPSDVPYNLPVPLQLLWRSDDGLPLYAATCFTPEGGAIPDTIYWHKKAQSGRLTGTPSGRFARETIKGRWMERRVPTPVTLCRRWTARCVGNAAEILRLLKTVSFIGKRRSIGFGEVERWEVDPLPLSFAGPSILVDDDRLTRPIPVHAAPLLPADPVEPPQLIGWTMPQWKPSLFSNGWRCGTMLPTTGVHEIDYFAALDHLQK